MMVMILISEICFQLVVVVLSKTAIRESHPGIVCPATKGNFYAEKQIYLHDDDAMDENDDKTDANVDHCKFNQVKD